MFSELIRSWIQKNCNRWLHGDGLKVEFGITGTVTLSNLHLRTEELDLLQLPLECKHLFIERIHFDIPLAGGTLGRLLVEASGIYMVVNTQPGGYALFDPRKSRLALQALVHLWSMTMAKLFSEIWMARNRRSASMLLGTEALLGVKATKVAKGASAGVALRSIMSITRDAKVSLKHVHIRMEDTGVPGPNSLAWEAPAIATGLIVGSLEIRKSDQPADSKFPELPEWDVEKAEGTASIDHTFASKGLTVYWKDIPESNGELELLGRRPLAKAIAELRRPFFDKPPPSAEQSGADAKQQSATDCVLDESMVCLLENVELSLRLYLQVNMGTSVSAELYSFPWRIVALRAQLLAPVIHLAITEEQIKIAVRAMALVQGWVRTVQRSAMMPVSEGRSFRNIARERWGMIRRAIFRDTMRRCLRQERDLSSAQLWRGYFRTWRYASKYIALRKLLRRSKSALIAIHTFRDSTEATHMRFFEGQIGQMQGSGHIPDLEEGNFDHPEALPAEDVAAANQLLASFRAENGTYTQPSEAVLKALYSMQLQLDSFMPPRVTAACRLLEHMRSSAATETSSKGPFLFPFLGCLLVLVADVSGIRPIIANAGLDAYCTIVLKAEDDLTDEKEEGGATGAPISQHKTTDIADFHVAEKRALWGQILPFACPESMEGPDFVMNISCMDKGVVMDHNIGSATLARGAVMAESHKVVEHQLPLVPKPSSSGVAMGDADGSGASGGSSSSSSSSSGGGGGEGTKIIRLFTVWIPEGCEGLAASKAKEDLLSCVRKIADEPRVVDQPQSNRKSRWDFWSIPEADLCVDIGMLKVVLSSTVREPPKEGWAASGGGGGGEGGDGGGNVGAVSLEPALNVQMHKTSLYVHAGPSADPAKHGGKIWSTWTAQFDLLRLLVLPRPASAGLTASPLDLKLGPLTLSSDLSPDGIRDAIYALDRDTYSKMKPHDVVIHLARNTPIRIGAELGAYRMVLSSTSKIMKEVRRTLLVRLPNFFILCASHPSH